jgi:hypothetical protein
MLEISSNILNGSLTLQNAGVKVLSEVLGVWKGLVGVLKLPLNDVPSCWQRYKTFFFVADAQGP